MPVLLQINVTANWGSTGRIAEQINVMARLFGWDTYIMYGRRMQPCSSSLIHIGNKISVYEHYAEHRIFDNDGLASRFSTRKMIREIERICPDIIHLHNIHDHWLNYKILFEYLNTLNTPIVWTQHDCWSFTGNCGHFVQMACKQWIEGCSDECPMRNGNLFRKLINQTRLHYNLKKQLFLNNKSLTLVPVSNWLEGVLRKSFLGKKSIVTINNGVDLSIFKPVPSELAKKKYGIGPNRYVIGVATSWSKSKGLFDYIKLAPLINKQCKIVLVGLEGDNADLALRHGILPIPKTMNMDELAALYSGATIVLNLSYQESFGLTIVEGFACGTPGIVYNCTASPELITSDTGIIVEPGDVNGVANAITKIFHKGKDFYSLACIRRAEQHFNKEDRYRDYMLLYEDLLKKK